MNPFRYPAKARRRRHGPLGYAKVESFRPWLRDEFSFCCVYCRFREQWSRLKGAFTIDHFLPVSLQPGRGLEYDNLLYACLACNLGKAGQLLPDPTQVLLDHNVIIHPNGRLEGRTREARQIIAKIGLNDPQEAEARVMWIGIIALAEQADPALFQRLMGYPDDLPNLEQLRPPGGNSRPEGVADSYRARRQRGLLPAIA
jgi:HNH endonuclease